MSNRIGDNLVHFGANEELIRMLTQCNVSFVIVGGLAVAWHCQERTADDMDILVEPTQENSNRIARALDRLNISFTSATSFAKPALQVPLKQIYYAELLTPQDEGPNFTSVKANAVNGKLFNIPVYIASVSDIIQMKGLAVASSSDKCSKQIRDIELLRKVARE